MTLAFFILARLVRALSFWRAMTPDKDPQNYSMLAYLAFGGLSVWGGLDLHTDGETRGKAVPMGRGRRCCRWWCQGSPGC